MNQNIVKLENIKELHVELGYQCNLRCLMCFQNDYTQKMDDQIWREKLVPLYPHLEQLIIQGGEPTIIKASHELVDLALQHNPQIKFGMMTNGLLFNDYWQKMMVEHGFMVNFSVNGANKQTHELVNCHSNFERVLENLQNLIQARNQQASELEVIISFVIIEENFTELTDFIALGKKLGVDKIRFFFDASRLPVNQDLVTKAVGQALKKRQVVESKLLVDGLIKFYQYYCMKKKINNIFASEKEIVPKLCVAPWQSLYVDHYGKLMSCCMSNIILGNLATVDLQQALNARPAQSFRRRMARHDFRYCQDTCLFNTCPTYHFTLTSLWGYWQKFKFDFARSPQVALKKVWRKVRQ